MINDPNMASNNTTTNGRCASLASEKVDHDIGEEHLGALGDQQHLTDTNTDTNDRFRGLVALLVVVVIWVVSNEVMQYFMEGSGVYNKPVIVTTICAVSFSVFGIRFVDSTQRKTFMSTCVTNYYCASAGLFCVLWIAANLAFNTSLASTSPASAVTLSSTSATFTLLGSIFLRIEQPSTRKAIAVLACLVGTVITASVDSADTEHPREMHGDMLAFASAVLYSGYLLLFQKAVGKDIPTESFMVLVGVWGLLLIPLVPMVEPISSPGLYGGTIIVLNAVIGACSRCILLCALSIVGFAVTKDRAKS